LVLLGTTPSTARKTAALSRDHFQLSLTPKSIIVDYFGKNGAYRKIASGEKSALVKGENYSLTEGDNHFFLGKPPQDIELLIKVGPLENLVGRRRMFWENLRELLRLLLLMETLQPVLLVLGELLG
jgi:hypothetical protein